MSDGSQEIDLDQLEAAMQLADNISGGTGAPHALTISPRSLRALIAELRRHRAMVTRLEAWAGEFDEDTLISGGTGVGPFVAAELRNRMKGGSNG